MKSAAWEVHKFGGTSVANADRYNDVSQILTNLKSPVRRGVVVSAMSKVTDALFEIVKLAETRDEKYKLKVDDLKKKHYDCVEKLLSPNECERLKKIFTQNFENIGEILRAVWHAKEASASATELIVGHGEVWSAQILHAKLLQDNINCSWLDAREVLVVDPLEHTVNIHWDKSQKNLKDKIENDKSDIIVITGYVASTPKGVATTLKRNGSDFSAAIFGQLFNANEIFIWTDVDGVMSADPRLVPDAVVLSEMTYAEAGELAYFGAKVVHPDTMAPAIMNQIPIWIKNTFRPHLPGTKIWANAKSHHVVKGFATIDKMTIINLEGTGMVGIPGVAERLFGALKEVQVSVVMISQASSEQSICIAVKQEQGVIAKKAIQKAFEPEIFRKEISQVSAIENSAVLAMVGDGMAHTPGVAGRLFSALGLARINCLAIAQGSSERNISVAIPSDHINRAVRAAHSAFFLSHQTLSIGIVGTGVVGSKLLEQLSEHSEKLKATRGIDLRIRAISNSKNYVTSETGFDVRQWQELLKNSKTNADIGGFSNFVNQSHYPHAAIVDVTSSEETTALYADWMLSGLNIITANKKAGSGEYNYYKKLHDIARKNNRYYMYETTVGAGLPIIRTIRDLKETGDEIIEIEGVMSGTMSYLFNNYDGTKPFSEIVLEAKAKGLTEPDPRDDLSGTDVGRKLVILAREAGFILERNSVNINGLVPKELEKLSPEEFIKNISKMDAEIAKLFSEAKKTNSVLRYIGRVDNKGQAMVALTTLPLTHPFARLAGTDNIFLLRTKRYFQQPIVIQGPGAGPDVTAAGVFAELIRLADHLGAPQ